MPSSIIQILTPTIAQSMGIDAWGWVKICLLLVSIICLFIQLCLLAALYVEKRVPSIIPTAIGFLSSLFLCILTFGFALDAWDSFIFFSLFFGSPLFLHALLIVITNKLRAKFQREQLVPRCEQCDYNLTENVTGQCPECGKPLTIHLKARVLLDRAETLG